MGKKGREHPRKGDNQVFEKILIKIIILDAKFIPKRSTTEEDQIVGYVGDQTLVYGTSAGVLLGTSLENSGLRNASTGESSLSNSEQQLPSIDEEHEILQRRDSEMEREKRRTVSDMHCAKDSIGLWIFSHLKIILPSS